jgi:hypothetical protein
MGWSGRVPAPPAIEAGKGRQSGNSHREIAAALCPFFHRSHNSAFCTAVNQIRDVTMAHLLIPQD